MANGDAGDQHSPYTAAQKIRDIYADIHLYGYSRRPAFAFGRVEKRMSEHAAANGITLGSRSMYMSPKSLSHARRGNKERAGLVLSIADIATFPKARRKMDLYFDGESYIYTDYKSKFIIHPNYVLKTGKGKSRKVAFITAGKANQTEFNDRVRFTKI